MLYKGEKEVKILFFNIRDLEQLHEIIIEEKILRNLNSVDFDLVHNDKTHEINLLDIDVINNNGIRIHSSSSDMEWGKVVKILYKIQLVHSQKREI